MRAALFIAAILAAGWLLGTGAAMAADYCRAHGYSPGDPSTQMLMKGQAVA